MRSGYLRANRCRSSVLVFSPPAWPHSVLLRPLNEKSGGLTMKSVKSGVVSPPVNDGVQTLLLTNGLLAVKGPALEDRGTEGVVTC
jgi:hypothetical protein